MEATKVRAAKSLLERSKPKLKVSPRHLVRTATELQKSLAETIRFLLRLKMGSQMQSHQRQEMLRAITGVDK